MGTLDINRLNKFFCKKVFVETNDRGKTFPYLSSLNHNFMLKSYVFASGLTQLSFTCSNSTI